MGSTGLTGQPFPPSLHVNWRTPDTPTQPGKMRLSLQQRPRAPCPPEPPTGVPASSPERRPKSNVLASQSLKASPTGLGTKLASHQVPPPLRLAVNWPTPRGLRRKNCIVVPRSAVNWHSTRRMRNSIRIHLAPPSTRPDTAGPSDGEAVISTNRAKDRADAQRLVTTRLLDRLHDPLGHFSRLQRIYPRAW